MTDYPLVDANGNPILIDPRHWSCTLCAGMMTKEEAGTHDCQETGK